MHKFIKDIFTGIDNLTWDVVRILLFIFAISGIYFQGWYLYLTHQFDITQYYLASGGLLTTGSAALWIKKTTEPPIQASQDKTPSA